MSAAGPYLHATPDPPRAHDFDLDPTLLFLNYTTVGPRCGAGSKNNENGYSIRTEATK